MDPWDGWPFARLYLLLVALAFIVVGTQVFLFHWRYAHWGLLAGLGEVLPDPDYRVSLAEETDDQGVPVARVTFSYGDNDRLLIERMRADGARIMEAAGADRLLFNNGNHHVLGTCRMGHDPDASVVDADCRSHDVENLWICDGSVLPTVGAVNPSLTIQALATRTARWVMGAT